MTIRTTPLAWLATTALVLLTCAQVAIAADSGSRTGGYSTGWQAFGGLDGGCDGHVQVMRRAPDGDIYMAGLFESCGGTVSPGLVRYHPPGNSFHAVAPALSDGIILDIAWYQDELIVAGMLLSPGPGVGGGVLRWTGSEWRTLGVDQVTMLEVRTLLVHDGELVAGGRFGDSGDQSPVNIARWNGTAWSKFGDGLGLFNVSSFHVAALAVHDGQLVAAGRFNHSGAVAGFGNVARWDGSAWQPMGWLNSRVASLLVDGQGSLVAGGALWPPGGTFFQVHRWNGSGWLPLAPDDQTGFDQPVAALALHQGELIAAGPFSTFGSESLTGLGRWTGTTWVAYPGAGDSPGSAQALLVDGPSLYVGGVFDNEEERGLHRVGRLDGGWHRLGPVTGELGMDNPVSHLASEGTRLVAAGGFRHAGDRFIPGVALWQGRHWQRLGQASPAGTGAVAFYQGDVYVASDFVSSAGEPIAYGIARWRGHEWEPVLDVDQVGIGSGRISAMRVFDGELVVGGNFVLSGETTSIARWDGARWALLKSDKGIGLPADREVLALGEHNGRLVAGGDFNSVGGLPASGLAYWDGVAWTPVVTGLGQFPTSGRVDAIAVWQGDLYIADSWGSFVPFARLQGNQWQALSSPGFDIHAMAGTADALWIGGSSDEPGAPPIAPLVRWDGTAFHPVPGDMGAVRSGFKGVRALEVHEGELMVGGQFVSVDGQRSTHIARLQTDLLDGIDLHLQNPDVLVDEAAQRIHYRLRLGNRGGSAAIPAHLTTWAWPMATAVTWTCEAGAFSSEACPADAGTGLLQWITPLAPGAEFYLDITLDAAPETVVQRLRLDLSAPPVPGADNRAATGLTVTTALADEVLFADSFESGTAPGNAAMLD